VILLLGFGRLRFMDGRRQKLVAEILLFVFLLVFALSWAVNAITHEQINPAVDLARRLAFPVILALWVASDAQVRHRSLCYDFDTFVFFAWPVMVPYYLFRTRGSRAFVTLLAFVGIYLAAMALGWGSYWILLLLKR
jgi:hypothetical protein